MLPLASANGDLEPSVERIAEGRVDIGVVGLDSAVVRVQLDLRLDALPARRADVLEIAETLRTGIGMLRMSLDLSVR